MYDQTAARFYGRGEVLGELAKHLEAVRRLGIGRILAVRGRRQVGKSTVVERFVESADVPYVFATGVYGASTRQQLDAARLVIGDARKPLPGLGPLQESPIASWREWLGRLAIAAQLGPVIAVLDEFAWLIHADESLEGELQVAWDRTLEKLPVFLILIGSDVAMMERLTAHGRPLSGRLHELVVPALNPAEIAGAIQGVPAFDVFDAYLVTGGYPRLVTGLAMSGLTVPQYVEESLCDAFSPLVTTGRLTLDAEFPSPMVAYQVLSAIGSNDTARPGFNDVLSTITDPAKRKTMETAVTRAITTLMMSKRLIEREVPAWAKPAAKLRRYRITDPYLRFWFRYIERNVERISRGRGDLAVAAFERDWPSWRGHSIEPVVRNALESLAATDPRLPGVESVRPWWTRNGQVEVDVVAMTNTASALLGSVKWRVTGSMDSRSYAELSRARQQVPNADSASLAAITPNGKADSRFDVVFTADDLLNAWA